MHWCASSRTTHASTSTYTCTQVLSTRNNRHSHLGAHALRYTYTHITRTHVRTCYAPTCPPHARQSSSFACTDVHVHERTRAHTCLDGMHRRPYTHATRTYTEPGDHSQMCLYTHGASIHVNLGHMEKHASYTHSVHRYALGAHADVHVRAYHTHVHLPRCVCRTALLARSTHA